ncbi:TRAUB domain protein, partial [Ostertagia ostertagi]
TWEQLLYVKIKLQAALRAFNQLPRGQLAKDLLKEADEETKANLKTAHENAAKLVFNLLEAEHLLLAASSFTSSIVGKEGAVDSDDEEIESSDDETAAAAADSDIESVCSDKQRLVKRSRVKKSDIERIGGNPEAEEDEEIYDDDDFYQVLLKELISKKSNNTQDPVAMTRYLPIPKLVNFHPAMPEMVEWSHETRNELFKSLFS